ncbi:hypothetical protein [Dyadobacter fermentans]|uniref:Lipoprotein n=1 Tax=Dyadobacter fermentans (strain ATCC 700827 / DSM 18053 / CIP 107007 / KCTC 52180 / NS114) TaxID=471854 RepID=C6W266_DYAFD|nr:hypothetical protein [Dyadobacter fermentans]ACT92039.1 hypothetical protein Dfer_0779 [Dyadobacter fermentans DSM 18053]
MRAFILSVVLFAVCIGCAKQPSLPSDSKFNVTAVLNDTAWFGTGKVLRLIEQGQKIENAKKFTLVVFTDIDYPGMGNGPNPNTDNGCVDPECTRTQGLLIYNVPLKKGTYKISKLDKKSELPNEHANFAYIGNSGGMLNRYIYTGSTPGTIKITKVNKALGTVEGRFDISFSQDTILDLLPLRGKMRTTAHFRNGLFRIKITDVLLK